MEIKILGPGCAKCNKTEKLVKKIAAELKIDANIEKVTDMLEIAGYGVMQTPAVVIDKEIKCVGNIPQEKDVISWLKK